MSSIKSNPPTASLNQECISHRDSPKRTTCFILRRNHARREIGSGCTTCGAGHRQFFLLSPPYCLHRWGFRRTVTPDVRTPQVLKEFDTVKDAERHDFGCVPGWGFDRLIVRQKANRDCIVFVVHRTCNCQAHFVWGPGSRPVQKGSWADGGHRATFRIVAALPVDHVGGNEGRSGGHSKAGRDGKIDKRAQEGPFEITGPKAAPAVWLRFLIRRSREAPP
jgi:hypothetical protein